MSKKEKIAPPFDSIIEDLEKINDRIFSSHYNLVEIKYQLDGEGGNGHKTEEIEKLPEGVIPQMKIFIKSIKRELDCMENRIIEIGNLI